MRNKVSLGDKLRYKLTITDRTENYYRLQYEHLLARHLRKKEDCLKIGDLKLPLLSHAEHPTREEAYYAMEIGDILYPGLFDSYKFVDEGPYEWLDVEVEAGDVVFDCGANLGIFPSMLHTAARRSMHLSPFLLPARLYERRCRLIRS